MSYPTFQDRYGAAAAAPTLNPAGAAGQADPQQMQSPWSELIQSQDEMSKKLDPWAVEAQNMNPQQAQSGGKNLG